MTKFVVDNGPHIKSKYNTSKMMNHLIIALLPIIIFSCYKNGFYPYFKGYGTLFDAFKPILLIIVGIITSLGSEILFACFFLNKKNELKAYLKYSYAIFPGLFLALIIPVHTPFSILIIGTIFATIIGKMLFGGFGNNIFNPALVGYLFIMGTYQTAITKAGGYLSKMEIDTLGSATPLTNLGGLNYLDTYHNIVGPYGNLKDFLLGFIPGSLGETSALLCLLGLLYLIITKVINWRIPVIYLATVFMITGAIGYYHQLGLWYPLFHILSGGLMFGAIFMATDPVTSPTTPYGQVIYALLLGLLTVAFRFLTNYPEGVATAILTMNMLVFIIDRIGAKVRFNLRWLLILNLILFMLITSTTGYIAFNIKKVDDKDLSFQILNIKRQDQQTIYQVTHKAFHGIIKADITINHVDNKITDIIIIEQKEDVWSQIENADYLKKIIHNQADLGKLDTIAGATYTTNYLKQMAIKVMDDYHKRKEEYK